MMILNRIHGNGSREFALGSDSLYNSSVPPQHDICVLSPTCRVPMTAAGALRLPSYASVRTWADLTDTMRRSAVLNTDTVSRSAVLNTTLYRSLYTAQDLRTDLHCRPDSREFFSTAVFKYLWRVSNTVVTM
jgi:hypothetical protein